MTRVVVENGGTDWLTPVATLLAVIVGGLLNMVAQSKLAAKRGSDEAAAAADRRSDEAAAAAKQRDDDEAVAARLREADERAAARVIQGDLAVAASLLQGMTRDQQWFGFQTFALPHWEQTQLTLARAASLSGGDWKAISQSALELLHFENGMRRAVAPDGPRAGAGTVPVASDVQQTAIWAMWQNATGAYNRLAALSGVEPVEGLLHDKQ